MKPGEFLCGCPADKPRPGYPERYIGRITSPDGKIIVMGEKVCPEHGKRLYGWRSPTIQTVNGARLDYSKAMIVVGVGSKLPLRLSPSSLADIRPPDWTDEERDREVKRQLAEIRAAGNGSA